jgi:16S rRNA (guanine527-N7)-methyltransferase
MRYRGRPSSGRRAGPRPAAAGARPPGDRAPQDLERTLRQAAAALDLTLPGAFATQVETYLDELERWQRIGSLTGYQDRAARVQHLVLESLMLLAILPEPASPLLDIGSGPGVPGLIVKLARPDWEVVLVEAARRRANFLRQIVRQLGLTGVSVDWGRAEPLADGPLAGRFRTVTMRAVASGPVARRLAAPFLAPDGALVLPVGPRGVLREGRQRELAISLPGELPWRRQFLIIRRTELDADVSRGTERAAKPQHRDREPEGRRREDNDRR